MKEGDEKDGCSSLLMMLKRICDNVSCTRMERAGQTRILKTMAVGVLRRADKSLSHEEPGKGRPPAVSMLLS